MTTVNILVELKKIAYTVVMNKTILIAGKDAPAGGFFATAAIESGRNALITVPQGLAQHEEETNSEQQLVWNRSSPISSRSLIVQAENKYSHIDEALLIFDASNYATRFSVFDAACFTRAVDEMMLGYFYLTTELLQRFEQRKKPLSITFLLQTAPNQEGESKLSIPVLTAQETFVAFAQHFVTEHEKTDGLHILLAKDEANSPDETVATWLYEFLDTGVKKNACTWFKTGSKPTGLFSFLK